METGNEGPYMVDGRRTDLTDTRSESGVVLTIHVVLPRHLLYRVSALWLGSLSTDNRRQGPCKVVSVCVDDSCIHSSRKAEPMQSLDSALWKLPENCRENEIIHNRLL